MGSDGQRSARVCRQVERNWQKDRKELVTDLLTGATSIAAAEDKAQHDGEYFNSPTNQSLTDCNTFPRVPPIIGCSEPTDVDVNNSKYFQNIIEEKDLQYKILERKFEEQKILYERNLQVLKLKLENRDKKLNDRFKIMSDLRKDLRGMRLRFKSINLQHTKVLNVLSKVFTKSQVHVLINNKKRPKSWDKESMSTAFSLRYLSRRTYSYLRNHMNYPLPSIKSLQRWASSFDVFSGEFKQVIEIMKIIGEKKTAVSRLTVISFDEVESKKFIEYNVSKDCIMGPHKKIQVVYARGLYDRWKQPIYAGLDKNMTKEIMNNLIKLLYEAGYTVVACVSDMGSSNRTLWNEYKINLDRSWFAHPQDNTKKIYIFADAPHMLKLTRNWLLDYGFKLGNNKIINKKPLEIFIAKDKGEYKLACNATEKNLNCRKEQRQNVKLAASIMSKKVAIALKEASIFGPYTNMARHLSVFIKNINDWFDIFNSFTPGCPESYPYKCGYGRNLAEQDKKLDEVYQMIRDMRANYSRFANSLQVFQKAILISISSLRSLRTDMENMYGMTYILTHRLNQDCLENFFSQVRARGGHSDHPSPLNALYRIRMIILGKISMVQENPNTKERGEGGGEEEDEESKNRKNDGSFLVATMLLQTRVLPDEETCNREKPSDDGAQCLIADEVDQALHDVSINKSSEVLDNLQNVVFTEMELCGVRYVAGWIARKNMKNYPQYALSTFKKLDSDNDNNKPTWIQHLSNGGLIEPSEDLYGAVLRMDKYFKFYHGNMYRKGDGVIKKFVVFLQTLFPDLPEEIIRTYARIRTFIRIKYLNYLNSLPKEMRDKIVGKPIKIKKKINKIIQRSKKVACKRLQRNNNAAINYSDVKRKRKKKLSKYMK